MMPLSGLFLLIPHSLRLPPDTYAPSLKATSLGKHCKGGRPWFQWPEHLSQRLKNCVGLCHARFSGHLPSPSLQSYSSLPCTAFYLKNGPKLGQYLGDWPSTELLLLGQKVKFFGHLLPRQKYREIVSQHLLKGFILFNSQEIKASVEPRSSIMTSHPFSTWSTVHKSSFVKSSKF